MSSYTTILAVKNGSKFIQTAIESVINQTVPPQTIIVSDDGSSDGTQDIIRSQFPDVKLLCNAPGGQGNALNKALLLTSTKYVAFLDHDDVWDLKKSAIQLKLLEAHQNVEVVYGCINNITNITAPPTSQIIGPARALGASMFLTSCFDKVGVFRTDTMAQAIIDWWSRAVSQKIEALGHEDVVMHRYIHGNNFGLQKKEAPNKVLLTRIREHRARLMKGSNAE